LKFPFHKYFIIVRYNFAFNLGIKRDDCMNNSGENTLSLWLLLEQTRAVVHNLHLQVSKSYGLDPVEWQVLLVLFRQDGQRPSDLAKAIGRAPTSFTPTLDSLEHKGYLQRQPSLEDRRSVSIFLTSQARKQQAGIEGAEQDIQRQLTQRLSPQDYATLQRLLLDFSAGAAVSADSK
jgi:DNA-binding MarR family transcriptional regulator